MLVIMAETAESALRCAMQCQIAQLQVSNTHEIDGRNFNVSYSEEAE